VTRRFSPLDEELGLLPGPWTPRLQEAVVRLGAWIPSFAQAATLLAAFTHTAVSAATARRQTEAAGAAYVAVQTAAVAALEAAPPVEPAPAPALLSLSADGAMVPLIGKGQWAEVKTLAVGEVQPAVWEKDKLVVHTTRVSYFSRLTDAASFTRLALVETQRRGVPGAGTVVAVTDGALWLQEFIAYHRPDAVRVLDWCHAVGYLGQVATACFGATTDAATRWLAVQTKELLEGDPAVVLAKLQGWIDELTPQAANVATTAATLAVLTTAFQYLQPRCAALQYATFRALGYPVGSGTVESANKLVVEARLKGAGMHWARPHVDGMVALRTIVCSDRWEEAWPQVATALRQQARARAAQRRQTGRVRHRAPQADGQPVAVPPATPPVPPPRAAGEPACVLDMPMGRHEEPSATRPTTAGTTTVTSPRRPAASHVWRRGYRARQPQSATTTAN